MGREAAGKRLKQVLRERAEAEFNRLNPSRYIAVNGYNIRRRASADGNSNRVTRHEKLYRRWCRRFGPALRRWWAQAGGIGEPPALVDMRHWELRYVCRFVVEDEIAEVIWWNALHPMNRLEVCEVTRKLRALGDRNFSAREFRRNG